MSEEAAAAAVSHHRNPLSVGCQLGGPPCELVDLSVRVVVEALVGDHALRGTQRGSFHEAVGGQRVECFSARVDEAPDVAVVLVAGMELVVVRLLAARFQRSEQRQVKALAVGDGIAIGLLRQRVHIFVGDLEGEAGAHDLSAQTRGASTANAAAPSRLPRSAR